MTTVRIVADDLTGALDAAAPFAATAGPLPVLWEMPPNPRSRASFALDSETRDAKAPRTDWIEALRGGELAFKKIDSLLRGPTVDEIAACLAAGLFESALIAPAFPAQQRITRGGRQYWRAEPSVDWQLLDCDLLGELRRRGLPIRHAASGAEVAGGGFFLCDAVTEDDLRTIVDAGRRLAGPVLWVGTAGLARARRVAPGTGHDPAAGAAPSRDRQPSPGDAGADRAPYRACPRRDRGDPAG
jgi:hypothetical protein